MIIRLLKILLIILLSFLVYIYFFPGGKKYKKDLQTLWEKLIKTTSVFSFMKNNNKQEKDQSREGRPKKQEQENFNQQHRRGSKKKDHEKGPWKIKRGCYKEKKQWILWENQGVFAERALYLEKKQNKYKQKRYPLSKNMLLSSIKRQS